MSAVIGIDVGSSAIKGVLRAEDTVLCTERVPIPPRLPTKPQLFEHDPIAIRDATFDLIRLLSRRARDDGQGIRAIAFTGQMHGGLIVDDKLRPLTNFVTWQDKRGTSMLEALERMFPHDPTGVGIHNGFLLTTLAWWSAHGGLPAGSGHILGIYDWLTSLLAGRAVTDITSAAAWAMFDPVRKAWRSNVFDELGISAKLLPEVLEPGATIGQVDGSLAEDLGLPRNTQVHASIGDTQSAYLGAGCTSADLLLNFGTGSQSMWETSNPVASPGTDIRYLMDGRFLATAPTLAGGEAYHVMAEFIRDVLAVFASDTSVRSDLSDLYPRMDQLSLGSSTEGIRLDPFFAGSKFRAEADRASITGLTAENFRAGPLLRALIAGMIEEVATPYFEREGRIRHTQLIGAGSGIRRNRALREVAEQRFGVPLVLAPIPEEAALGVAKLCG